MPNESKSINRVKVSINGEDYYVKGTVPTEYIKQVARYRRQENVRPFTKLS
jgi:hypothetical protein